MKDARIIEYEIADGLRQVNGRPHGINWKSMWDVEVTFDNEDEANKFLEEVNRKLGSIN